MITVETTCLTERRKLVREHSTAGKRYRYVQLQGVPIEITDTIISNALSDTELSCIATQEDYPLGFGADPDRAIARAVRCGAKYLSCALIPRDVDSPDKLREFADKLRIIAAKVKAVGLTFAFHPIGPDMRDMEGKPVYERLMELLPDDVQLTFCIHAALSNGVDPLPILKKYAGRIGLVHFKDDAPQPDGTRHLMPLGSGVTDWAPILKGCSDAGVKYIFVEQERWLKDAFDCARDSYDYLVHLGM